MNNHEINLTFKNVEESEKWVQENCPNGTYQDEVILMIQREASVFDDEVTIKSITTF